MDHMFIVILEAIEQAQEFGLDMITLPFHTSHAFQPLDIYCFEPFETTLTKEMDVTMARRKYSKLDKLHFLDGLTKP